MAESKTPQFDKALDEILKDLVPHTRTCLWKGKHGHCEGEFPIEAEDIEFLKMLRVPAPNYCPTCRRIRRLTHMGMVQLFKRQCNVPGHDEMMISIFPANCPFPVYDYKYFIGDDFDPFSFGVDYDSGADHLKVLFELRQKFPMPSFLNRDPGSVNSEYSNGGRDTKNAYYAGGCFSCEDVWYTNFAVSSKVVMDSRVIHDSDHVYRSLMSDHLYKCSFSYFSNNLADCAFMFDCHNCTDCFGCVNIRNKKYVVFNEQLSKKDYEKFMEETFPLSRTQLKEYKERFWQLVKSLPMNASHNVSVENVSGVTISNSKDLYDVVDADRAEHIRHADSPLGHHDSMDLTFSGASDHLYGTTNIGSHSSWVKFSVSSKYCTNSEFIFNSKNLDNCFMCFGLQNKSHCILNKQYEPLLYFRIVDEIKTKLLKEGNYGDGLGLEYSAQAYNVSLGEIAYSLTKEEVEELGGYVAGEGETNVGDIPTISISDVGERITEVDDALLAKAIRCEVTGRPFRIVPTELAFYRKMQLPIPTTHPQVRMVEHLHMAPTGKKYSALCAHCGKAIYSLFDPKENYLLYCESCYQEEVV